MVFGEWFSNLVCIGSNIPDLLIISSKQQITASGTKETIVPL